MAYDEFLADRARQVLKQKAIFFEEKKMIGGLCFMVDEKLCFCMHIDKKNDESLLMARIGPDQYEKAIQKPYCIEMNSEKGYVYITEDGLDLEADLSYWIQLCLDFNPQAKRSKKKKSKK